MKYKLIAIPAQDTLSCEMFQRLALSFGYQWGNDGPNVKRVDPLKWLSFDPNVMLIEAYEKKSIDAEYAVATNSADLLKLLSNPPPLNKSLVSPSGACTAEIQSNGWVKFGASGKSIVVEREIVKVAADALGYTQKAVAPLVKFEYPETARGGLPKLRFVRLVSLDDTYLKGYEVEKPSSVAIGEFKNFVRNRILDGGKVEIVKFSM
jgi:hypothetical protein